jgi:hypothetical protein
MYLMLSQKTRKYMPLVSVPVTVEFRSTPCKWEAKEKTNVSVRKDGQWIHPIRLYEHSADIYGGKYFDAWEVRESFLQLQTDENFLNFLNRTGSFSPQFKDGVWGFEEMRGWQDLFRGMMKKEPQHWPNLLRSRLAYRQHLVALVLKYHQTQTTLRWQKAHNSLMFRPDTTLSAIYTTIVLDKLAGSRFGFCARKDCRREFEIGSHPNKRYCSHDCAHLEVVRRGRQRAASARS